MKSFIEKHMAIIGVIMLIIGVNILYAITKMPENTSFQVNFTMYFSGTFSMLYGLRILLHKWQLFYGNKANSNMVFEKRPTARYF